jgi:hypothetical protein
MNTKITLFATLFLLIGCSTPEIINEDLNNNKKPLKITSLIKWEGNKESRLILIDLSTTQIDTILNTTEKSINIGLIKRRYYEAKIINDTQCINRFKVISENKEVINVNSNIVQTGCLIQFFNK